MLLYRGTNTWVRDILKMEKSRCYNSLEDARTKKELGDISI